MHTNNHDDNAATSCSIMATWPKLVCAILLFVLSALLLVLPAGCLDDNLAISPNGNEIVLSLDQKGDYWPGNQVKDLDLYLYQLKQNKLERLTNNSVFNGQPDYSPDAKSIVFARGPLDKDENYQLLLMDLKSTSVKPLGKDIRGLFPDWAPKSTLIKYVRIKKGKAKPEGGIKSENQYDINIFDTAGKDEKLVTSGRQFMSGWDSEGKCLYYLQDDPELKLMAYNIKSGEKTLVVNIGIKEFVCLAPAIVISPDSKYAAFTARIPFEHKGISDTEDRVFVVNLERKTYQIIPTEADIKDDITMDVRIPQFSPSGILSMSYGHDPWHILLYENKDGKWIRQKTIEGAREAGWWGNFGWILIDGKEYMLAPLGSSDSSADYYDLHILDPRTGNVREYIGKKIKEEFKKLQPEASSETKESQEGVLNLDVENIAQGPAFDEYVKGVTDIYDGYRRQIDEAEQKYDVKINLSDEENADALKKRILSLLEEGKTEDVFDLIGAIAARSVLIVKNSDQKPGKSELVELERIAKILGSLLEPLQEHIKKIPPEEKENISFTVDDISVLIDSIKKWLDAVDKS